MYRYLLATTAVLALSSPAAAETVTTKRTEPLRTSTIKNGTPDAITIGSQGSVVLTDGTGVTMDSNHAVTNQGAITVGNANGAVGIAASAGTSGDIVNSGTITVDEPYTPTDVDKDGDLDGPFAVGSDRYGIRTYGAHTGKIANSGTIRVEGNDSAAILLGGPLTGQFVHDGTTTVLGDRSTAVQAGEITGKVRLAGQVGAIGEDAVAARFTGDVTGAIVVQGAIASTGYRNTTAPTNTSKLDADDLLQGGSALVIEGDVTGGIVLAVAPADTNAGNTDEDSDGIEDSKEGSAKVTSYGAAPAMVIGAADRDIAIGPVANTGTSFGVLIDGTVTGAGVYSGVDGNGLVIGGRGGAVNIANGIGIAGSVTASSNGASATALRLGAGATVPEVRVSGSVSAAGGGTSTSLSTALLVDEGATVGTIRNSGAIKATASGTGGSATAILDRSGGVSLIENSGAISASGAAATSDRNVAIDLSANTSGATVRQTQVAANVTAPSIAGDVRFGAGSDVFDVADGTVKGTVSFGAGSNRLALSGDAAQTGKVVFGAGNDTMTLAGTSSFSGDADFGGGADLLTVGSGTVFAGTMANAGGLAVSLTGGLLDVRKPTSIGSLNLDGKSVLLVTLDKTAGSGTSFDVAGDAVFAKDARLALRLADVQNAEGRYVVLEAGALQGASGIVTNTDLIPFMFKAAVAANAAPNTLAVDVARRTTTELGLNGSQSAAYNAIFAALENDEGIESVFLGITNGDQFRQAVRQMLPDHAGGAFQSVSLGTRAFARQIAEPQSPVYSLGGIDVILSTAAWGADKSEGQTAAYDLGGFGFSASGEVDTGIGAFGATATWLWNEYTNGGNSNKVLSDTYELAGYWRGTWGGLTGYGRGSIGMVDFGGRRTFTGMAGDETVKRDALSEWDGTLYTLGGGLSYEGGWQHVFFRPAVSVDYLKLEEDGYTDTGGGEALDLIVDDRSSDELALNGGLTLGVDFSGMGSRDRNWFRVEGEGGWREILDGAIGSTTARFDDGTAFTLDPEQVDSGWFARLRALGGTRDFSISGEVGAEDRLDTVAYSVRGALRFAF